MPDGAVAVALMPSVLWLAIRRPGAGLPQAYPEGGYYMVMDAGTKSDLTDGVSGKRVPKWILPPIGANSTPKERHTEEA